MTLGVVLFIVALLIVIMVHEAGHFLVAKALGFKATKFFVGFGPTLWSFTKGETEYGIKAIPAGGFVKIVGMNPYEDVSPADEPRSYPNKPRWQRALMIAGGPATHWPLGFVVLVLSGVLLGLPTAVNVVAKVEPESPAAEAGFLPGDRILTVDGVAVEEWEETQKAIRDREGQAASFVVLRDGRELELRPTVGTALFSEQGELVDYERAGIPPRGAREGEISIGFLGLRPRIRTEKDLLPAVKVSLSRLGDGTKLVAANLAQPFLIVFNGDLFEELTGNGPRTDEGSAVGVVGMGRAAGQTVQAGEWLLFIDFLVLITIFVGMINLLPLPPLDGGHLAVILYETITRRRVDIRKLIPVAVAVISFFVLLFFAILYLDLARPLKAPL